MARTYTTHDELMNVLRGRIQGTEQQIVARELGVSPQMLSDVLRGKSPITERIAEALGYRREFIFRKTAA